MATWTKVDSRLPEYGERVLVTRLIDDKLFVQVGFRERTDINGEYWMDRLGGQGFCDVVGWAELPMGMAVATACQGQEPK